MRLLNRDVKAGIELMLEKIPFVGTRGRRTLISMRTCDICDGEHDEIHQIIYPFTGDYNRLVLKHCSVWTCRLNAIRFMYAELKVRNIVQLIRNLPIEDEVRIPRSNGS